MLGAICGDIVGSRHEFNPIKTTDFELFNAECGWTDDTVCTVAVADALMGSSSLADSLALWVDRYTEAGFGFDFLAWALRAPDERVPYGSWGNGAAMRASPAGWLSGSLEDAARLAALSAAPTHDNHHGIRGAKATAVAVRLALEGWSREEIGRIVNDRYGYDLSRTPDAIRPNYRFHVSCQRSVPEALCCLLNAESWEQTIRLVVSLGGDADTQGAIAGAVAEPLFGLPPEYAAHALDLLPPDMAAIHARFRQQVSARTYERSDPSRIERDIAPPRDGPDPFSDEAMAQQMQRIQDVENAFKQQARRRAQPGLLSRIGTRLGF